MCIDTLNPLLSCDDNSICEVGKPVLYELNEDLNEDALMVIVFRIFWSVPFARTFVLSVLFVFGIEIRQACALLEQ